MMMLTRNTTAFPRVRTRQGFSDPRGLGHHFHSVPRIQTGPQPCRPTRTARSVIVAFRTEKTADQITTTRTSPQAGGVPTTSNVLAVVLGGGASDYDKLFPLTSRRALPAVPVGGQHRLIDIPLSNLINSGISKIYVLTQFQSQSLNRYLTHTYNLTDGVPVGGDGFVEVLSTTQSPLQDRWSQGTADAVRQFAWLLEDVRKRRSIQDVIVLPADQLYQTDFGHALEQHRVHDADLTLLCSPVDEHEANNLGIVQVLCPEVYGACTITRFEEKPKGAVLNSLRMTPDAMYTFHKVSSGLQEPYADPQGTKPFLASTGIYIFRREALIDLLHKYESANDFGKDLIPCAVRDGCKVLAVELLGPWKDVGVSLAAYYNASMELICQRAPTFLDALRRHHKPLYKSLDFLPAVRFNGGPVRLVTSYVAPGSTISGGCVIEHSIIGARSVVGQGCVIQHSCVLGMDYYEQAAGGGGASDGDGASAGGGLGASHQVAMGIGANSVIKKAIVDKNARVGAGVQLVNVGEVHNSADYAALGVWIRDGIIVVSKGAVIPPGTII